MGQDVIQASRGGLYTAPGTDSPSPGRAANNGSRAADPASDTGLNDPLDGHRSLSIAWSGWRLRVLIVCVLLGCLGQFALIRQIALTPHMHATWQAAPMGQIKLTGSSNPALWPHFGKALTGMKSEGTPYFSVDAQALLRSSRWLIANDERAEYQSMHKKLAAAQAHESVTLSFAGGSEVQVWLEPRGLIRLPLMFWLLCAFGFGLYLVSAMVLLARPTARNLLYGLMAWSQAGNMMFIAVESTLELGLAEPFARLDMPLRMAFDLITAAAMVNAACLHPRRLPCAKWIGAVGWVTAFALIALFAKGQLEHAWWSTQTGVAVLGLAAIGLLSWSYQIEPHPFALVLRRFGVVTISTWTLLTLTLAAADRLPSLPHNSADIGSLVWYVFFGSLLILGPFLAKSHNLLREFSLLTAIGTVATSLDLLFVAVFSLSQFASLTLSLLVSLVVYSAARQWMLNQLLGSTMLTMERIFEQLYRIAREIEAHPDRTPTHLAKLLGDIFEPLEVNVVARYASRTRVAADGSSMLVPVPQLDTEGAPKGAVLIRFAQNGRRLFTWEDARLTDRINEQLRRAVHFDKAVEQGRSEERLRLAQDLHDDIGARLLTLLYKAQSPEMEDYVRHTLQDLKTLTRGLAAANHRLSHAAVEWKADLTHRLTAAHVELKWSCVFDDDIHLTVVHWSALTRVLRELVSNVIAHSQAHCLDIDFRLENDRIDLLVTDNGIGTNPSAWSHGLGLGGVRKRVKQLGGSVEWNEVAPRGISCRVVIRDLSTRV